MIKHAQQRAQERYNLKLDKNLEELLINLIKNNKAILIKKQSKQRRLYYIEHNNKIYKIVYAKAKRKGKNKKNSISRIITFLPPNFHEYAQLKQNQEIINNIKKKPKILYWLKRIIWIPKNILLGKI